MNVNRIDQSQKRLNYYSRSSPKKKKNTYYVRSPLLSFTTIPANHAKKSHHSSIKSPPNSSFKIEIHEIISLKDKDQILIQQCNGQEILIDDPTSQQTRGIITDIKTQIQHFNKKTKDWNMREQIQIKSNDIKIEDDDESHQDKDSDQDNEKQVSHFDLQQGNKNNKDSYIKIQNQQQPTMNRQFTFANQFADKSRYQNQRHFLPITIEEEQYSDRFSSQQLENKDDFHSDMPYFQSNMEYQVAQSMKKKPLLGIDIPIIQVFDTEQHQSPKFNTVSLRRMEDKWITAEDYHLLSSPQKHHQILIQQGKPSNNTSSSLSIVAGRPFGNSIILLNQIIQEIPQQLLKVYSQMHRKLIGDQIKIEQQLQRQQNRIKILRMLINLRKNCLQCQDYLLSSLANKDQEIEINQIIINSLIKKIIFNKQK